MKTVVAVILAGSFFAASAAFGHSGGTDSRGCHVNHKTGVYHCH